LLPQRAAEEGAGSKQKIQSFPAGADGLPDTIYGILEDAAANLWLSSRTGIFRVARSALDAFANGSAHTVPVSAYGAPDGMKIRECSGGGHPSAWKMNDGSLWFATLEGVSSIDPARAQENRLPPPVAIEALLIDDRPASLEEAVTVKPGANRLEFQYAGLSFVAPQKVRYRYRLFGFDRGWIDAGTRRAAFYTNLPPGEYRFQVLAANNDGVWNEAGAALALRIEPHFYQTLWFYSALVLAVLLLAALAYRWRVRQVESGWSAVLAERSRLAREIHDTLAQGYVGISVQLELLSRLLGAAQEPARQQLDETRALVRSSLAEARTSIWQLRSQNTAQDLPARLAHFCGSAAHSSPAKVYLQVKGTYHPLDRAIENELQRIGQEAVLNALRHAEATRIDVQLIYDGTRVCLKVDDNGRGFPVTEVSSVPVGHFGLQGMRERAAQIGAVLIVESQPGKGTQVCVELARG
ncbi:MAG TPA: triple tyrosine motif-containing protein, partial [Acidobacteriaceae bacterium]|nr:triple tyrosine motif-containing protein [Acidobacteriaceae bacterium]